MKIACLVYTIQFLKHYILATIIEIPQFLKMSFLMGFKEKEGKVVKNSRPNCVRLKLRILKCEGQKEKIANKAQNFCPRFKLAVRRCLINGNTMLRAAVEKFLATSRKRPM